MKRLALVGVAVMLALALALAYLSTRVSVDAVLRATAEKTGSLTGYSIRIHGPTSVSFLPFPTFEARDVTLVFPLGDDPREIASVDVLRGSVELLPLLAGRIVVDDFVLVRPRLDLTIDRRGRPNWTHVRHGAIAATSEAPDRENVRIGSFRIREGKIVYVDQRTGIRQEVSAIDATVSWPRLASPLDAAGALIWNGEAVRFGLNADAPLAYLGRGSTPIRVQLESGVANARLSGNARRTPDAQLEGTTSLSAPSLRSLLRWIGVDPGVGPGLNAIDLSGQLNFVGRSVSLADLVVDLDGNDAEGAAKVVFSDKGTDLQGTLAFEALDLGVYRSTATGDGAEVPAAAMSFPVDLSALARVAADIRLSASSVTFGALALGRSAGTLTVRNGAVDLGVGEATLYGGTAQGTVSAAPVASGSHVKAALKLDQVDIGQLLVALTGDAPVTGMTTARINLSGTGKTVGEIVASLGGDARLSIGPGSIEGIDVGQLLGALEAGKVEGWPTTPARTVIDRLTATFAVEAGNAATNDFHMKGPNVEVQADGEIRLVSASLAGHGTADLGVATESTSTPEISTYAVPFVIEGPIANPLLYPDPVWLLNRETATPEEIDRIRTELQQSTPEDVIEDIVQRGIDRLPRLPPAQAQPTTPQE